MSKDVTLIVRAEQNKSAAEKYTNEARINHSDNLAVRCHGVLRPGRSTVRCVRRRME